MYKKRPYNFGCLPMPEGYSVMWHDSHEHYQAHGPDDWDSCITCDPYQARQWCLDHATARAEKTLEGSAMPSAGAAKSGDRL